jgi:Ser/Thr protein kinase RdoA (MazF antagonist)
MPPETTDESVQLELARRALTAYDLPAPVAVRLHGSGLNTVFHVTAKGRSYALRLHRPGYRTTAQIRSELQFVQYVAEQCAEDSLLDVPCPIRTRNGELVVTAGDALLDLTAWVEGDVLVPGKGLTADAVSGLGRALASLHNLAARYRPPDGFELPRWDADGMFLTSPYRPDIAIADLLEPRDLDLYQEIAERTRTIFAALDADARGIIHGDYILGNCYLQPAGSDWQVAVFDFDDCGWGYFLYDLCPLLGNLAGYPGTVPDNPDYPLLRDAFLAGYRTKRPLPVDLEQHLPTLMAARNANHCLLTARYDVSPTPVEDAAWRMRLARQCLRLEGGGLVGDSG